MGFPTLYSPDRCDSRDSGVSRAESLDMQHSVDKLSEKLIDQVHISVDKFGDDLFERVLKASALHHASVDTTTLGKPGHVLWIGSFNVIWSR